MHQTFRILSNTHRCRLLVALLDHDSQSDEPILIPEDIHVDDQDVHCLHIEMVHNHLPRLADAGLITWDRDAHAVHRGPRFEELQPLLELLTDNASDLPGEWVTRYNTGVH